MKRKGVLFFCIILLTAISFSSCFTVARQASKGRISDELMIAPDPSNPFQGTWIDPSKNYLHVIDAMNGTWYVLGLLSYERNAVYTIEETDNGFVTSNHWRISVNGNILTVENMTYERVVK
jgi:hypothetical protein